MQSNLSARQEAPDPLFPILRHMAVEIFRRPFITDWVTQGTGMLRCYFGPRQQYVLNLWDRSFAVPGVPTIHNHPWHVEAWVMAGVFVNTRYLIREAASPSHQDEPGWDIHHSQRAPESPVARVWLRAHKPEICRPGDTFRLRADEVHEAGYEDGTVTINERRQTGDSVSPRVFWPYGKSRVEEQPRPATPAEIFGATSNSLRRWFAE